MRVVYNSFEGAFSDSPRVIFEALAERGGDDEHVWVKGARYAARFPPSVATVPYGSAECVAALEAADLVIANTHTDVAWQSSGRRPAAAGGHPAVRDVSAHDDVSELYLAPDVLITDYSSVTFDFAITGKPILLHTYDLADFQHRLRGFSLDLAHEAPGPLLPTTDEVIGALRERPWRDAGYRERYARFQERFCHLEDGRATDRVLSHVSDALERKRRPPAADVPRA